jgi:hypothetical protein
MIGNKNTDYSGKRLGGGPDVEIEFMVISTLKLHICSEKLIINTIILFI